MTNTQKKNKKNYNVHEEHP